MMQTPPALRAPLCDVLAFGLLACAGSLCAQTPTWMPARTLGDPPPIPAARVNHAMAFDAARGRVVLFGGSDLAGRFADTWEWDGLRFAERTPAGSPSAYDPALVYDAARAEVLLFTPPETWAWDGVRWTLRASLPIPGDRVGYAMCYDSVRARVVLFGGFSYGSWLDDTWEWDGTAWSYRTVAIRPQGRSGHAMAYDPDRQRTVLVAGTNDLSYPHSSPYGDTWEWDGTQWQRVANSGPAPRTGHTLAYDPVRRRIVLFGGIQHFWANPPTVYADTWEWDGSAWRQVPVTRSPPPRDGHAVAEDPLGRGLVLFGGFDSVGFADATWLYGALIPAAATPFGSGCAGTAGDPRLSGGEPYLGRVDPGLRLESARPASGCVFAVSVASSPMPLGGGCTLYPGDPIWFLPAVSDAGGVATVALPGPVHPSLRGVRLFTQAVVLDPQGPFAGLAFSAGLELLIGD